MDLTLKGVILMTVIGLSSAVDYNLQHVCGPMQNNSVFCSGITIGDVDYIQQTYPSYMNNLTIQNSNITKLSQLYIERLYYVTLKGCQIEEIKPDAFSFTILLNYLNLDRNNLVTLPSNVFGRLGNLEYLYISHNQLKAIDSRLFNGLRNLKILDLRHNQIDELPENVLAKNKYLQELHFSNNFIKTIDRNTFNNASAVKILHLQNNFIQEIQMGTFAKLINLEEVNLANNNIKKFEEKSLPDENYLKLVNLSNNQLKNLEHNNYGSGFLDLSNNLIETIENNAFKTSSDLKILSMSKNYLNNMEFFAFFSLHGLETLDMSRNNLKKLYAESFMLFQNIQSIDFSWNKITEININCFEFNSKLIDLNLAYNQIENIEFLTSLCNIVHLNLSRALVGDQIDGNKILSILSNQQTCITQMQQTPELNSLDLTYNQLEMIDLQFLQGVENLQFFYLEGNNLIEINYQALTEQQVEVLEELGLGQNDWNCTYLSTMIKFFANKNAGLNLRTVALDNFMSPSGVISCIDCAASITSTRSCNAQATISVDNLENPNIPAGFQRITTSPVPIGFIENSGNTHNDRENRESLDQSDAGSVHFFDLLLGLKFLCALDLHNQINCSLVEKQTHSVENRFIFDIK